MAKTGNTSQLVHGIIPLTGLGLSDLNLVLTPIEPIPTFTVDVNPYIDLIDSEFRSMVSRSRAVEKHLPFALFQYYCIQLWWYRALVLMRMNGQALSTDMNDFLDSFDNGAHYIVPNHIAQYLANMGNFMQEGETFFFRLLDVPMTGKSDDLLVRGGWVDCSDNSVKITTGEQFWAYAQLPVPGVAVTTVVNEIVFNDDHPATYATLDAVAPDAEEGHSWSATPNIAGWVNPKAHRSHNHKSAQALYHRLGWSTNRIPTDMQTCYLFSASSMRAVSDTLLSIKDKTFGSDRLAAVANGSPIQACWLEEPVRSLGYDYKYYLAAAEDISVKATLVARMSLASLFPMDRGELTPAFAFGYRLARPLINSGCRNGEPTFEQRSNFAPWIYILNAEDDYEEDDDEMDDEHKFEDNAVVDPPAQFMSAINRTWNFGSANFFNEARFQTEVMSRAQILQNCLL